MPLLARPFFKLAPVQKAGVYCMHVAGRTNAARSLPLSIVIAAQVR